MIQAKVAMFWVVLAAALGTGACVSQQHYVETRDALIREQAGHHETTLQLRETGGRLAAVERERDQARREAEARRERLERTEGRVAQLQLDVDVAAQQREEAARLVDQLRSELARVGTHLRAFSDQRDALRTALDAAEDRLTQLAAVENRAAARAVVIRDLAVALHRPVATGEVELAVVDGRPVLRLPAARVFPVPDGEGVDPEGDAMLKVVADVASAHPGLSIHLTEVGVVRATGAPATRLGQVSARLIEYGVERSQVIVEVPPEERAELAQALGEGEPGRIELALLVAGS